VKLYQKYISHRPTDVPSKAFYLTPLKKPQGNVWYTKIPVGHNTLSKTVKRLCAAAGIEGYKTNHSLRVTAATRLFKSGVDEQLIMSMTGHRSIEKACGRTREFVKNKGAFIYPQCSNERRSIVL
jgi:integrase